MLLILLLALIGYDEAQFVDCYYSCERQNPEPCYGTITTCNSKLGCIAPQGCRLYQWTYHQTNCTSLNSFCAPQKTDCCW